MENNPLTEEKAIPRPELGCGSAYDCFYRLDVISAKRLLRQMIVDFRQDKGRVPSMATFWKMIDTCFQISDNSENCKNTNKVSNTDGDEK
jgi:hypothetical protein